MVLIAHSSSELLIYDPAVSNIKGVIGNPGTTRPIIPIQRDNKPDAINMTLMKFMVSFFSLYELTDYLQFNIFNLKIWYAFLFKVHFKQFIKFIVVVILNSVRL